MMGRCCLSRRLLLSRKLRKFSSSAWVSSLPPAPALSVLATPEDMMAARAWIAAFEKVDMTDLPKGIFTLRCNRCYDTC